MKVLAGILALFATAVSSVAIASPGIFSYKWTADATLTDQSRTFVLYINPHTDTILLQASWKEIVSQGQTLKDWTIPVWRHAAETFVAPVGCGISDVAAHGPVAGGTWEASFVCPAGIDLRKLAADQRASLMKGVPLHP